MKTSRFSFPRRVRIHGGECGAVARALHHAAQKVALVRNEQTLISDEKAFLSQAGSKKVFDPTFHERKLMSTKTAIKRIALAAVVGLTGGLLSIVSSTSASAMPANRNIFSAITAGSVTSTFKVARVGQEFTQYINVSTGSTDLAVATGSTVLRINALWTQVPAGDTYNALSTSSGYVISPTLTGVTNATLFAGSANGGVAAQTQASGATPAFATLSAGSPGTIVGGLTRQNVATYAFTPRAAGTYKALVWSDDAASGTAGAFDANDRNTTFTIVAGGTPTAVAITSVAASVAGTAVGSATTFSNNEGAGYIITLTDAAGNKTIPGVGEALSVSASNGTVSDSSLTTTDFNTAGQAFVQVYGGTAGLTTLTVTPAGALSGLAAVTNSAATFGTAPTVGGSKLYVANTTGVALGAGSSLTTLTSTGNTVTFAAGTTLSLRAYATGGEYLAAQITDTSGGLTGRAGTTWSVPLASGSSTGYASFSLATTGISAGSSVAVAILGAAIATHSVTFTAAASALDSASTLTPATSTLVTGGGVTLTLSAVDQFGLPVANAAVSWSRAGRNATTATTAAVTDADGIARYTYVDASTSTTSLTDTVSAVVTYNGASITETATVSFGAGNAVSTVTVSASPTFTSGSATSAITTGAAGADATTYAVSVTIKDASGSLLAGVPVTWTTSNAKSGILVDSGIDYATTYTNSTGVATTYVYGWVAPGSTTVTATAGGKTATTTINFVNAATDARTISVAESGGVVVATVKDRFGNPVKDATVTWSRVGTGFFGNGVSGTTGQTDADGKSEVLFNGSGTVKAELLVASYPQVDDAAGFVGTTATSGIGATLAPAGIGSATVAVSSVDAAAAAAEAAADAAAEAIDAANAATDAANLAAEAADAATVAAEEARDAADAATAAVEELATQVATLMAALKAQITTLANTVAKIAKKVKA